MELNEQTLRHEALVYGSDEEFCAGLVPFLVDGVDSGEAAVVVTTANRASLLRRALDGRAGSVRWVDAAEHYRRPPQTVAAYEAIAAEALAAGAQRVRVVGEVQFGVSPVQQASWIRYESVLNEVFAAIPLWVVCPYDRRVLPPGVVESAARSHPHLRHVAGVGSSDRYQEPRTVLRELELLGDDHPGQPVPDLPGAGDVRALRHRVYGEALRAGLTAERADAFVVAVNEVVTNALVHGRPPVEVRLWVDQRRIVCDVADNRGGWDDLRAGYVNGGDPDERGRGLWLARCLADDVVIRPQQATTVVRLVQADGPTVR